MFVARDAREFGECPRKYVTKQAYTCPSCGGGLHYIRTEYSDAFAHERLRDCMAILKMKVQNTWATKGPLSLGQERLSGCLRI